MAMGWRDTRVQRGNGGEAVALGHGCGARRFVPTIWEQLLHSRRCCRAEGGRAKGWGAADLSREEG